MTNTATLKLKKTIEALKEELKNAPVIAWSENMKEGSEIKTIVVRTFKLEKGGYRGVELFYPMPYGLFGSSGTRRASDKAWRLATSIIKILREEGVSEEGDLDFELLCPQEEEDY